MKTEFLEFEKVKNKRDTKTINYVTVSNITEKSYIEIVYKDTYLSQTVKLSVQSTPLGTKCINYSNSYENRFTQDSWIAEVSHREKLLQVILNRGSGQDYPASYFQAHDQL